MKQRGRLSVWSVVVEQELCQQIIQKEYQPFRSPIKCYYISARLGIAQSQLRSDVCARTATETPTENHVPMEIRTDSTNFLFFSFWVSCWDRSLRRMSTVKHSARCSNCSISRLYLHCCVLERLPLCPI